MIMMYESQSSGKLEVGCFVVEENCRESEFMRSGYFVNGHIADFKVEGIQKNVIYYKKLRK